MDLHRHIPGMPRRNIVLSISNIEAPAFSRTTVLHRQIFAKPVRNYGRRKLADVLHFLSDFALLRMRMRLRVRHSWNSIGSTLNLARQKLVRKEWNLVVFFSLRLRVGEPHRG
jgi:hypothetical protein